MENLIGDMGELVEVTNLTNSCTTFNVNLQLFPLRFFVQEIIYLYQFINDFQTYIQDHNHYPFH